MTPWACNWHLKEEAAYSPEPLNRGAQPLSCVQHFVTHWTVARQTFLSMGFFKQEYWSGLPFPSPGDLPDPGVKPSSSVSPTLQMDSFHTEPESDVISQVNSVRTE